MAALVNLILPSRRSVFVCCCLYTQAPSTLAHKSCAYTERLRSRAAALHPCLREIAQHNKNRALFTPSPSLTSRDLLCLPAISVFCCSVAAAAGAARRSCVCARCVPQSTLFVSLLSQPNFRVKVYEVRCPLTHVRAQDKIAFLLISDSPPRFGHVQARRICSFSIAFSCPPRRVIFPLPLSNTSDWCSSCRHKAQHMLSRMHNTP